MRYHTVYNTAYRMHQANGLDTWIRKRLRARTLRLRLQWTEQLRVLQNQSLGQCICPETLEEIERVHRLSVIGGLMRLRVLQRCIIAYLWRPHGPFFQHSFRSLTSTPAAGAAG
jgi:hypothetical protein